MICVVDSSRLVDDSMLRVVDLELVVCLVWQWFLSLKTYIYFIVIYKVN